MTLSSVIESVAVHILWTCEIWHSTPTDTTMRTRAMSVLLCLLLALVEVHSWTVPYLTFKGNNIPNNSIIYMDLDAVGTEIKDSVQCHTDLLTCCSGYQGPDRGDWYFPNGSRLPFSSSIDVYEGRDDQVVRLFYASNGGTSGIYRCDIDIYGGRKSAYIELYSGGEWSVLYVI